MDTDAATLEQVQGLLRRDNYTVLAAADGNAALRLIQHQQPSLIISDLLLAGLDGYKVWAAIRANEATKHIPILVISALTVPPPHEPYQLPSTNEWLKLEYDAYLPKPLDLPRLSQTIKKLITVSSEQTVSESVVTGSSLLVAVEDDWLRQELERVLAQHNFVVELTASLTQAEKLVRKLPPAAIILDYRRGEAHIRQIALQIKRLVPNINIILISTSETVDEILDDPELVAVCERILRTPLHPKQTSRTVTLALELSSRRKRNQMLTDALIQATRTLTDTQQAMRAQNEELQYVNEQLREIDMLKESFTEMVIHDLKSPLSALLGAINFTLFDPKVVLSDKTKSILNGAVGAGNQMLRLIETLLEGQRLQDGRAELDIEPFDLIDLVVDSLERFLPLLALHHLNTQEVIADNLPTILADPYITQRVIENLLDNAVKYSPRNSTIIIEAVVADDEFILVQIKDHGPGIPYTQQAHIFDRFGMVKGTPNASGRTSFGLGLAFCRQAVEAMGGQIWVESDGHSGTTFFFTLPIYREHLFQQMTHQS